jgi:putative membrane protein
MKKEITMVSWVTVLAFTIASICFAGAVMAADPAHTKSSSLSAQDKTFIKKAAKGGLMEVAMGNMAEQNAKSDDVKSFGKRMVTDHSKANEELKGIAEKKGVTISDKEPTEKWTSDKTYMNAMVKDHEKDLSEFREEASKGSDPDVKKFADDTAKVIQEHLDLAKETQNKLQ